MKVKSKDEYFPRPDIGKRRHVAVKKDEHFGYWDIDLVRNTADLRKTTLGILPEKYGLVEYTAYETIFDYLKEELKFVTVKEIIPNKKVIFSTQSICSVKDCNNKAYVILDGKKLCEKHSFDIQSN